MIRRFFSRFFELIGGVATIALRREQRVLRIFDLVSLVPDPKPKDVYIIYSVSDQDVYMIKWKDYYNNGKFNADPDKQVVYDFWNCKESLYKIDRFSINPYTILMNSSMRELNTFAKRMQDAFFANAPIFGLFLDPHDQHLMMVCNTKGTIESGVCTVYDLDLAPYAGITYFGQVAHVMRIKDVIDNYVLRPFDVETLVILLRHNWRKEVIENIASLWFDGIKCSEVKCMNHKIYSCGLVTCDVPSAPKLEQKPNTAEISNPESKKKK